MVLLQSILHSEAQLYIGFYSGTCSAAEFIVKEEVAKAYSQDRGLAAGLVRLHFHDCFVKVKTNHACCLYYLLSVIYLSCDDLGTIGDTV